MVRTVIAALFGTCLIGCAGAPQTRYLVVEKTTTRDCIEVSGKRMCEESPRNADFTLRPSDQAQAAVRFGLSQSPCIAPYVWTGAGLFGGCQMLGFPGVGSNGSSTVIFNFGHHHR